MGDDNFKVENITLLKDDINEIIEEDVSSKEIPNFTEEEANDREYEFVEGNEEEGMGTEQLQAQY